ncbi:RagB/SusD family nutrient uptake outer membrane protein [Chitinophaga sp. S165]|uniref:RagB/SusD family nutrient uptake outer membrane protein n=1 Tax=Chitinophaga sp. S165 TaxID=2135462 RepID=UPI000D7197BF|nr:RagB/SusD family nutrient uptake outer membrane protein [Chitinophaga sp. S165]PWV56138.1 SusD-like starch-binding protein associating with outer membrane [Chitinophaga sp. S165]
MRHFDRTILKRICLLACLGLIMTAVSSCSKLIEIAPPTTTISTSQTFSSNDLTLSAMAGVYTRLINGSGASELYSNGGVTLIAGLSADELICGMGTNDVAHYPFFSNNVLTTNTFTSDGGWTAAYKAIYSVNSIIEGIAASKSELLDDSTRRQVTGEAKFIRAFTYFYLTNMFGDVPLVITTDYRINATMSRTPQEQVYQQMVADLKDAQQLLNTNYDFARGARVRANKYAATALLARVYLYQKDWTNAAMQADSVIANGQYSLLEDLKGVFLSNSKEAILQFIPDPTLSPLYNRTLEAYLFNPVIKLSEFPPEYWPIFTDSATFAQSVTSYVPNFYMSSDLPKAFEAGDKRRTQWIDSVPTPVTAPYFGVPIYFPSKYPETHNDAGKPPRYYTVLRLGEQYLISAEAKAQLGEITEAQTALNAVRSRAGLPATTAADKEGLLKAIARERRTELFLEWGHRWMDLKRTGMAKTVLSAIPEKLPWKDFQLLYPLPVTELVNNPLLKQNPGYN